MRSRCAVSIAATSLIALSPTIGVIAGNHRRNEHGRPSSATPAGDGPECPRPDRSGRQARCDQLFDARLQQEERPVERRCNFRLGALRLRRIRRAPMQLPGLTRKYGTTFTRRLIADRNDQIEWLTGQFIPGFAAGLARVDPMAPERIKRTGMHMPCRKTPGTPGLKPSLPQIIDQRLGHDRAAGVSGTENQHFRRFGRHAIYSPPLRPEDFKLMIWAGASGTQQALSPLSARSEKNCASAIVR